LNTGVEWLMHPCPRCLTIAVTQELIFNSNLIQLNGTHSISVGDKKYRKIYNRPKQ